MKTVWLNICLALIVAINSLTQINVPNEYIAFGIALINMVVRFFGLKAEKRLYRQIFESSSTENLPPDIADAIMALITAILKELFNSKKRITPKSFIDNYGNHLNIFGDRIPDPTKGQSL